MKNKSMLRLLGAGAALAGVATLAAGTSAAADQAERRGAVSKIAMVLNQNGPKFKGVDTLQEGAQLRIVNKTKPQQIGPHTFSLVEKERLPDTPFRVRRCSRIEIVCEDIAKAHEFDPETGQIGEPDVDNGLPGWDEEFDNEQIKGDTWYTETEDETEQRTVTAEPGKLWYLCVIHPAEMQGKLEVVPGPGR